MTDEEDEKPLDPQVEAIRRRLVRLMVVSVGIMVIGLMAVFGSIVYKINTDTTPAVAAVETKADIVIPAGAEIVSTAITGSRMLLVLKLSDGRREVHVFGADGKVSATYRLIEK